MIRYQLPRQWIKYDISQVSQALVEARSAILSLTKMPCQKNWTEELQIVQLKREVAGTSRIEGADFSEAEFEAAFRETPDQLITRSQKQAAAAVRAYRWIAERTDGYPIDERTIREVHRLIIQGADDDHCPPGVLRKRDQNVTFGIPKHRGAEGGEACERAFKELCRALSQEFKAHDLLIQALALHYHFVAMHPFLDGNGRTGRALEAMMLQKCGLKDTLFIAMSNYYYEEKGRYLETLSQVRQENSDLTPFLNFGLAGIRIQCDRLFDEIKKNISRALYRNMMFDLFGRLKTQRKRVIAERQIEILKLLLSEDSLTFDQLVNRTYPIYEKLKNQNKARLRDLGNLVALGAVGYEPVKDKTFKFFVRLQWPTEITETEFFERIKQMPKSKTYGFMADGDM